MTPLATRFFAFCGALAGALTVVAGAFGSHALKSRLTPEQMANYDTAVRFQMLFVVGLFAAAWLHGRQPSRVTIAAGLCQLVGMVCFCGALYVIALTVPRHAAVFAPIGGLTAIVGWLLLAWAALRLR
jgi:uncharacterized membrane protein YgdD (TMEM256/DUF423 family)